MAAAAAAAAPPPVVAASASVRRHTSGFNVVTKVAAWCEEAINAGMRDATLARTNLLTTSIARKWVAPKDIPLVLLEHEELNLPKPGKPRQIQTISLQEETGKYFAAHTLIITHDRVGPAAAMDRFVQKAGMLFAKSGVVCVAVDATLPGSVAMLYKHSMTVHLCGRTAPVQVTFPYICVQSWAPVAPLSVYDSTSKKSLNVATVLRETAKQRLDEHVINRINIGNIAMLSPYAYTAGGDLDGNGDVHEKMYTFKI